jgi:hypothetical protein
MAETSGSGRRKPTMARRAKPGTPETSELVGRYSYRDDGSDDCSDSAFPKASRSDSSSLDMLVSM